jgi:hypothetical protein
MTIVRLKTEKDRMVNELLKSFGLPHIDYPNGYQTKPNPQLTGGSAAMVNDPGLKAVNELFRWTRRSV